MTGAIEFKTLDTDRVRWSVVTPDGEIVATGIATMRGAMHAAATALASWRLAAMGGWRRAQA